MAQLVAMGAQLKCIFGAAPASLIPTPGTVTAGKMMAATIMDFVPITNIPTFGVCMSPSNPAVIAAQGAPQPCVPVIPAPWKPGSPTVMVGKKIALNSTSTCQCTWAGVITVLQAGQMTVNVP